MGESAECGILCIHISNLLIVILFILLYIAAFIFNLINMFHLLQVSALRGVSCINIFIAYICSKDVLISDFLRQVFFMLLCLSLRSFVKCQATF